MFGCFYSEHIVLFFQANYIDAFSAGAPEVGSVCTLAHWHSIVNVINYTCDNMLGKRPA